jgi:hypothetical protein
LIIDENDSFKLCRLLVPSDIYYAQCKRDYCSAVRDDKDVDKALCSAFTAVGAQCASEHFLNIEWRRENRCRKFNKINKFQFFC